MYIKLNIQRAINSVIYSLRHAAGHQLEPARLVAMARACVAIVFFCVQVMQRLANRVYDIKVRENKGFVRDMTWNMHAGWRCLCQ